MYLHIFPWCATLLIISVYEQYYASLAASTVASAVNTPSGVGVSDGDDLGEDLEEDRKPSVEYLNSLNDYRKRSRSAEDIGGAKAKIAKVEENGHPNGAPVNGRHLADVATENRTEVAPVLAEDDPIVYGALCCLPYATYTHGAFSPTVEGKGIPFSQVTEEHQELMTPDEYEKYALLLMGDG